MSFIEEHVGSLPRASVGTAIGEAFGFLRDGGAYTIQLILFCGVFISLIGVLEDFTDINDVVLGVSQAVVESMFIYNWHRYALMGERHMGYEHWNAFMKRTLLYYSVLAVAAIFGVFLFVSAVGGLSDGLTISLLVAIAILVFLIVPRIALVFPAIAVNSLHSKMKHAFVLSSGNVIALAVSYVLMTLIFVLLLLPVFAILYFTDSQTTLQNPSVAYVIGTNLLLGFPVAVSTLLWAGLNSSLYRQLGGDVPAPQPGGTEAQSVRNSIAE